MALNPRLNDPDRPLVSILIPNYNYGRYLRECFDSVLAQTYDNIEINFSDNASTDESWEIALEYQHRYPDVFFVARNRQNFGHAGNFINNRVNARGKYFMQLCSDDALLPDFTKVCVEALESNLDTGFAMVHRTILNEHGERIEESPFYNQTCKIPGPAQAAVYMMTGVSSSISQLMYRKSMAEGKMSGPSVLYNGTRTWDFMMCCEHPIIYISTPHMLHRLHSSNDSLRSADNMMETIGPYMLSLLFADVASSYGFQNVVDRLPASIEKNSRLALRYGVRALLKGSERNALRHFHLSAALFPEIVEDEIYRKLAAYWLADNEEKKRLLNGFVAESNLLVRTDSYDPPSGSTPFTLRQAEGDTPVR